MKQSTLTLFAILAAAAAVAWYFLRPNLTAPARTATSGATSAASGPNTTRQAAEKAAIDLAAKAGGAALDWFFAPDADKASVDLGAGTGTADMSLDPYAF